MSRRVLGHWVRRFSFPKPSAALDPSATDTEISPCTYVLQRRYEPQPLRSSVEGFLPRQHGEYSIQDTYRIYDCVYGGSAPQPLPRLDMLLIDYVDDVGVPGDVAPIMLNRITPLLLAGKVVYNSDHNRRKYAHLIETLDERKTAGSSVQARNTVKYLSQQVLAVTMSMETAWTIEPWHVHVCFRKAHVWVPETCLRLPDKPITGPDIAGLQDKVFLVDVTVNGVEHVAVRCRIHHVPQKSMNRLPYVPLHWCRPMVPVFAEDAARLAQLPPPRGSRKLTN